MGRHCILRLNQRKSRFFRKFVAAALHEAGISESLMDERLGKNSRWTQRALTPRPQYRDEIAANHALVIADYIASHKLFLPRHRDGARLFANDLRHSITDLQHRIRTPALLLFKDDVSLLASTLWQHLVNEKILDPSQSRVQHRIAEFFTQREKESNVSWFERAGETFAGRVNSWLANEGVISFPIGAKHDLETLRLEDAVKVLRAITHGHLSLKSKTKNERGANSPR